MTKKTRPPILKLVSDKEPAERGPALEQWTCDRCEEEEGVATSVALELISGPMLNREYEIEGGTRILVCAYCWSKGRYTTL